MDTILTLSNTGEIVINNDILGNTAFKNLIRRDRGGIMEGDANGLKKARSMAELGLIWYCINLNSPGIQRGLSGKELEDAGKAFFGIPDIWKKDDAFHRAYEEYNTLYTDTAVTRSIRTLLRGLDQMTSVANTINDNIKIKALDANLTIDGISEILKLNSELMKLTSNIPDTVKSLKSLEETYLKEEQKIKRARGGVVVTASMIPKN